MDRYSVLGVRRATRRPSLARRLSRALDTGITRTQEWLEGEDRPSALVVGYGVIVVAAIYLVIQFVRWKI